MLNIQINGHTIVLCHYALRVWHKSHFNSLHFYGHSHGRLPGVVKSFDVAVDTMNFSPISINEAIKLMSARPDNPNRIGK